MRARLGPVCVPGPSRSAPRAARWHADLPLGTQIQQNALRTARRARGADGAAVPDQEVRELDPRGPGDDRHEVSLGLLGIALQRQPETSREAPDVRVDGDPLTPSER